MPRVWARVFHHDISHGINMSSSESIGTHINQLREEVSRGHLPSCTARHSEVIVDHHVFYYQMSDEPLVWGPGSRPAVQDVRLVLSNDDS